MPRTPHTHSRGGVIVFGVKKMKIKNTKSALIIMLNCITIVVDVEQTFSFSMFSRQGPRLQ